MMLSLILNIKRLPALLYPPELPSTAHRLLDSHPEPNPTIKFLVSSGLIESKYGALYVKIRLWTDPVIPGKLATIIVQPQKALKSTTTQEI
jgi:hypothetical protein